MTRYGLTTAGLSIEVASPRLRAAVGSATGRPLGSLAEGPDVVLDDLDHDPGAGTSEVITRGVSAGRSGVLLRSVGGSGFAQLWSLDPELDDSSPSLRVSSRWSPSAAESAAARLLPQRFRALRAQVLVHYPSLWTALSTREMSPLHVSVVEVDGLSVLLAGPGGVGKSSLVADALAHGAKAVCDNLGVSDGRVVHGLAEPLRLPVGSGTGVQGRRAAHGRREHRWTGRLECLSPDIVVVLRRDDLGSTRIRRVHHTVATEQLVAGTYAAGELQRFWPLVAQLGLAGFGPMHPPVQRISARLAARLPCYELTLGRPVPHGDAPAGRLAHLLSGVQDDLRPPPPHTSQHLNGSRS